MKATNRFSKTSYLGLINPNHTKFIDEELFDEIHRNYIKLKKVTIWYGFPGEEYKKKNEEKTKIIEKTINIIRSNSFSSIKNPDAISFVNQSSFENNEQNKIKIQKFLKEKINKKEEDNTSIGSASTIASFPDKEITDEECEILESEIQKKIKHKKQC